MSTAVERIVVQASVLDKQAIVDKAKRLDLSISELMRRGAVAYEVEGSDDDQLAHLADAARGAAERAGAAIDDAIDFIARSNQRIAAMERKALKSRRAA